MRRRILAFWLAVSAGAAMPAAAAERYALLVGVSALPALPRNTWLDGPRHDVPALRKALLAQGFAPARIVSLADGIDGAAAPTRGAVLAQLARLDAILKPGDVLVIYWSGHGMLMPGQPGLWQTPLGQQVRLLTQDTRVDAGTRQLMGGVGSADIGNAIDAFARRQVQVVALFDSCYAAGSTRGDAGLAWRGLAGEALGWTPRPGSLVDAPAGRAAPAVAGGTPASHERPRFIGFFAAEPQQRSAEALGSDDPDQARGLFTRALIAGLQANPASYLAWASLTNQYYRQALDAKQLPASARPSPVYAGALEQALWTAVDTSRLWPVRQDERGWYVPYGRLDGLQVGDMLQRDAAAWRVTDVNWGEARLAAQDGAAAVSGWARRMASVPAAGSAADLAVLERRGRAREVEVSLPGRAPLRLRVRDAELPALRTRAASVAALLALPSTAAAAPLVQARIEIQAPGRAVVSLPFADRDLGPLAPGTRLRVVVENDSGTSVDLGIVHLPLTGPAMRVFPPFEGDSNRLPPGAPPHRSRFEREFEVTGQGADAAPEWLALVAAPAPNGAMPRRFAVLGAVQGAAADAAERGAALATGRSPNQAQVARISWRPAPAGRPR